MGDRALGALEIRPNNATMYDYTAKYAPGGSTHIMPAPIHPHAYAQALDISLRAHRALGCRGVSRADLRYDDTAGEPGRMILIEINTQPGMTPTSLVPDIAKHAGIDFVALVRWMVENAACGLGRGAPSSPPLPASSCSPLPLPAGGWCAAASPARLSARPGTTCWFGRRAGGWRSATCRWKAATAPAATRS
jgi:hypothetical protein